MTSSGLAGETVDGAMVEVGMAWGVAVGVESAPGGWAARGVDGGLAGAGSGVGIGTGREVQLAARSAAAATHSEARTRLKTSALKFFISKFSFRLATKAKERRNYIIVGTLLRNINDYRLSSLRRSQRLGGWKPPVQVVIS